MYSLFLLLLPVATSGAVVLVARRAGTGQRSLSDAVRLALELAGISTLFLAANLALGVAVVIGIRVLSPYFVSIYVLNDLSLVVLSCVQGAVLFCWRRLPVARSGGGD